MEHHIKINENGTTVGLSREDVGTVNDFKKLIISK
jgi:hypothetical protein